MLIIFVTKINLSMVHYQIIHCSHCDGTDLQKNGKSLEGTQRWFCKECKRYFRLEYRYNACKKDVKAKIIEMTLNSSGVRDIGRGLQISKDTVTSELKKNFIKNRAFFFSVLCSAHEPVDSQEKKFGSHQKYSHLCGMFFKTSTRKNPQTGKLSIYYRLVENSRNALGGISQRHIMTVGYMDDVNTEELHRIADDLGERISGQGTLFTDSPKVRDYI